ncbi:MAG: hypothetical protein ACRDY1_15130 [Acidimicrobiales bacterium]
MTESRERRSTAPESGHDEGPPASDPDEALIDEVEEESFPASDSPSSWSGPPSPP